MITEHVNRIPVHLDGKTIYDIALEDSFDALAKEISALGTEKKKICIIAIYNFIGILHQSFYNTKLFFNARIAD